ncbi:Uncharacterised protein [Mycobacteroides abscessus subsp. massiliense]|nr:Uncharacterised protein [Mycobacteroides abscessus subsp. massiliense]
MPVESSVRTGARRLTLVEVQAAMIPFAVAQLAVQERRAALLKQKYPGMGRDPGVSLLVENMRRRVGVGGAGGDDLSPHLIE